MRPPGEWLELFRALGRAVTDLVGAELDALKGDLKSSGREAGIGAALVAGAGFIVFWLVGSVVFLAVAIADVWLPLWAAAAVVVLLQLLVVGVLVWLGLRRFERLEDPATTVRRRWSEHRGWWRESVLGDEGAALDGAVRSLGGSDEEEE